MQVSSLEVQADTDESPLEQAELHTVAGAGGRNVCPSHRGAGSVNTPPQSQPGPHSSPSLRQPHALVAQQSPSLLGLQLQPSFGGRAVTVEVPLRERCADIDHWLRVDRWWRESAHGES